MPPNPLRAITLISSPYHVGIRNVGVGAGPTSIQSLRITSALRATGVSVNEVEIQPVDAFEGEIGRSFELFRRTSTLVSEAHNRDSFPIILSGNCGAAIGVAAGYNRSTRARQAGQKLSCVWFDAHDDFNTPDTVLSGYFDSQAISMLAGECWKGLMGTVPGHEPMDLKRNLVHVGMRNVNELERGRVLNAGFDVLWGGDYGSAEYASRLRDVLENKNLGPTMVHFDVDSLDISLGKANQFAAPGGLLEEDLYESFSEIVQRTHPVSLTVASFDPSGDGAENIGKIAVKSVKLFVESLISRGFLATDGASSSQ